MFQKSTSSSCVWTAEETSRAEELVNAYDQARRRGEAAALTPDGRFVDPAVVAGAQLTLRLAALDPAGSSTAGTRSTHSPMSTNSRENR